MKVFQKNTEMPIKDKFVTTFTRESWGLGTVLLRMNNLPPSGGQFVMLNVSSPVDLEKFNFKMANESN